MKKTLWIRIGYIIGAIFLAQYWLMTYIAYSEGRIFSHSNYWGAGIGTSMLFILVVFFTIAWLVTIPKFWNGTSRKDKN